MIQPHMMIDLETMGLSPSGVIAQIGYVIFDPTTGEELAAEETNVDLQSCLAAGLSFDGDTIKWWLGQEDAARQSLLTPGLPLPAALTTLTDIYGYHTVSRVWAYPASFDLAILESAYRGLGRKTPWHYRDVRDARTLIAQVLTKEDLVESGVKHKARDDCRNQIVWLREAARRLGSILN